METCLICGKTSILLKVHSHPNNEGRYIPNLSLLIQSKYISNNGTIDCCEMCYQNLLKKCTEPGTSHEVPNYSAWHSKQTMVTVKRPESGRFPRPSPLSRGMVDTNKIHLAKRIVLRNQPKIRNQTRNATILSNGATCYACGKISPIMQSYSVSTVKTDGSPYFPLLKASRQRSISVTNVPETSHIKTVCAFCYHSLIHQWSKNATKHNPVRPEEFSPNLDDYICYVCGVDTYRRRIQAISRRKFPFLRWHNPPEGAIAICGGEWVVACLNCCQTLTKQWSEYERMKVPLSLRNYNWISIAAPQKEKQPRIDQENKLKREKKIKRSIENSSNVSLVTS